MTVILAVEPDPRQASHLSSVLRGRRNTEVVIARSADTAIESIAGRVPNVLLTSPLLSPQDETRLADWLRELGPSASHVQALTIPILAPKAAEESPQRGLLASLRRRTPNPGPHGCEPKMFAEHVAAYLGQESIDPVHEATATPVVPEPVSPDMARPEPVMFEAAPEPVMVEPALVEPVLVATVTVEPVLVEPAIEPAIVDTAPMAATAAVDEDEGLWLLTRSPQIIEFADEAPRNEIDTLVPGLASLLPSQDLTLPRDVKPVAPFEVIFELPQVITVRDDACEPVSQRSPAAAMTAAPADTDTDFSAQPVRDEWGLFDPSKCGFSALLARLDEISDEDRRSSAEAGASVRLVTHY
jgi:CheY-like chemotaxis protein